MERQAASEMDIKCTLERRPELPSLGSFVCEKGARSRTGSPRAASTRSCGVESSALLGTVFFVYTELLRFIRPGKREDGVFVPTPWADLKTQADPDLTKYQRKCYLVILSSALRMTAKEVLTAHEQEGDGVPLRALMTSASAVVRFAKM